MRRGITKGTINRVIRTQPTRAGWYPIGLSTSIKNIIYISTCLFYVDPNSYPRNYRRLPFGVKISLDVL
jgi:hypothetical protein